MIMGKLYSKNWPNLYLVNLSIKKEGTRNYAKNIQFKMWNLSKFKVLKKFKINQNLMVDNKTL